MVSGAASRKITAACEAIAGELEAKKLRLCAEIDAYAPAARDARFSSLDAEVRQGLLAALHDANP